jgi:hypothetical protein
LRLLVNVIFATTSVRAFTRSARKLGRLPDASDQPYGTNVPPQAADTDPVLAQKFSASHILYLAAIAAATAGWLWLIARILMWSTAL